MNDYFDDIKEIYDDMKRHRQDSGRQRIQQFKQSFPEVNILKETDYSIRFIANYHIYDFYPQKCRLFVVKTAKWHTLNRRDFVSNIRKIINGND